ncbi:hypothetical protein GE21DRAFT_1282080 [Neurospora crassa]|nr:hypothetical protein GE21DRAFT_1282080 [Neurospora crassa]
MSQRLASIFTFNRLCVYQHHGHEASRFGSQELKNLVLSSYDSIPEVIVIEKSNL